MPTTTTGARPGAPAHEAGPVRTDHHHAHIQDGAVSLAGGLAVAVCVAIRLPEHVVAASGARAWGLALAVVVAAVSGARLLARAPFTLRSSFSAADGRGGAVQQWATREVSLAVAGTAAGILSGLPLYAMLHATRYWWLLAWLLFAAVTVVWQLAMPLLLRASAGKLAPAPEALAERVQALARRAGVDAGTVLVAGKAASRRCNAYVVGLGPTRRVVLEQAVAAWPPELVDQAVAHELGHWRLGHTSRRLPLALAVQLATLAMAAVVLSAQPVLHWAGLSGAGDPRSYPLLLTAGALLVLPARCLLAWLERAQERAADRFALTVLHRPDDLAAMLRRAAADSGVPTTLPWWRLATASHPPIEARLAACALPGPAPLPRLMPTGA